ncbi:unnamed protein product [Mytilus edulis]|uniref:Uncharacterized protein n=1 Tax=Mytilus edulis TaxID=6550 RepID=A0A8S3RSC2_MYTED|nr:unnamed protein product [Mytilus edulis]
MDRNRTNYSIHPMDFTNVGEEQTVSGELNFMDRSPYLPGLFSLSQVFQVLYYAILRTPADARTAHLTVPGTPLPTMPPTTNMWGGFDGSNDQAGYLFTLKFDRESTHSSLFLSDDNTVLGNSFTKETPNPVNHPKQFNTYIGTIGNRCLTSTSKLYFEITFSYEILGWINSTNLVLEVAVASREKLDSQHYVGYHGWSFILSNCNTSICLKSTSGSTKTVEKVKIISSSNTAGTVITGRLGFFVNMDRHEFSVIDKDSSKILSTFTKVVSADQLCLAFGIYNHQILETKTENNVFLRFQNLPIINVVA